MNARSFTRTGRIGIALALGAVSASACTDSVMPTSASRSQRLAPSLSATVAITDGHTWSEPEHLSELNVPGFNTRNATISTNGLTLYFGSDRPGGFGALDIYVSHRANPHAPWQPPQNVGAAINGLGTDNNPYPTSDGHTLFFTSNRAGGSGGPDLWMSERDDVHDDLGWTTPVNLGPVINTSFIDSGPVYFVDPATGRESIFFSSTRPGGQGSMDFYVSIRESDGSWGPGVIIPELNSPFDDNKLSIRADGLEVYLSSNRPGGGQGAQGYNIWEAARLSTEDAWSTPVLAIESSGLPAVSVNGREMYMVSRQPGTGVNGVPFRNDLYVSTRRAHE